MRRFRITRAVIALALVALAPSATALGRGGDGLRRPLHLPQLEPGASCPVSHVDPSVEFRRFGVARGIGRGPVYPIGMAHGVLFLAPATGADANSPWLAQKVLWFVHPRYGGHVLVRGRRIDGAGLVRFGRGTLPATELRIPAGTREQPSFTRLRASGCYAYQVDGTNFSRTIVFRATA